MDVITYPSLNFRESPSVKLCTTVLLFMCENSLYHQCITFLVHKIYMMTSSNGNIFRVSGHLCGEFTGPWWIPHTKSSSVNIVNWTTTTYNDNDRDHNLYYGLPDSRVRKKYSKDPMSKDVICIMISLKKRHASKQQTEMFHSTILLTEIFSTSWY